MFELNSWHPITLPSMGRFYGGKMPGGNVEVTPWTTQQEEDLVRHGGKDTFTLRVLEKNVRLPQGMPLEDLVVGDQFFLLVQLRINSLSPFITYTWPCDDCRKKTKTQVDLRELSCRVPEEDEESPFDVKLPQAGVTISLKHQTVKDQIAVKKYSDEHNDDGVLVFRFSRQIESIDGHTLKYDEKKDFVRKLGLLDFQVMRKALNDRQVGYTLSMKIKCDHCGVVSDEFIPIENGFFRPDREDLERAAEELVAGNRAADELPCGQEVSVE